MRPISCFIILFSTFLFSCSSVPEASSAGPRLESPQSFRLRSCSAYVKQYEYFRITLNPDFSFSAEWKQEGEEPLSTDGTYRLKQKCPDYSYFEQDLILFYPKRHTGSIDIAHDGGSLCAYSVGGETIKAQSWGAVATGDGEEAAGYAIGDFAKTTSL